MPSSRRWTPTSSRVSAPRSRPVSGSLSAAVGSSLIAICHRVNPSRGNSSTASVISNARSVHVPPYSGIPMSSAMLVSCHSSCARQACRVSSHKNCHGTVSLRRRITVSIGTVLTAVPCWRISRLPTPITASPISRNCATTRRITKTLTVPPRRSTCSVTAMVVAARLPA